MIVEILFIVIVLYGIAIAYFHFKYPELRWNWDDISTEKISIGQTFEGRNIWAIKFSDNPDEDEDEAEVLYTGLHHAREPRSYMNLFYYIQRELIYVFEYLE